MPDQRCYLRMLLLVLAVSTGSSPVWAQSLKQRITDYRQRKQQQEKQQAAQQQVQLQSVQRKLHSVIGPVRFENQSARNAIDWWSKTTGISIVLHWKNMQNQGIEEDAPIHLNLNRVPANLVLQIILSQMAPPETHLIFEPTPWYVHIMTRTDALKRPVTRVYYMGDLLVNIRDFNKAPKFNLESALGSGGSSSGKSGSSSGSSGNSLFGGDDDDDDDDDDDNSSSSSSRSRSKENMAYDIAQLIRDSIEPDIWFENGGQYGSIRYYEGRLIVNAAPFVQRQIGDAVPSSRSRSTQRVIGRSLPVRSSITPTKPVRSSGVSGVQSGSGGSVSNVQGRNR